MAQSPVRNRSGNLSQKRKSKPKQAKLSIQAIQQNTFDNVFTLLWKQGVPSIANVMCFNEQTGSPRYQHDNGNKCSIGHLINFDKVDRDRIEGRGIEDLIICGESGIPQTIIGPRKANLDFLVDLQAMHDIKWYRQLHRVGWYKKHPDLVDSRQVLTEAARWFAKKWGLMFDSSDLMVAEESA